MTLVCEQPTTLLPGVHQAGPVWPGNTKVYKMHKITVEIKQKNTTRKYDFIRCCLGVPVQQKSCRVSQTVQIGRILVNVVDFASLAGYWEHQPTLPPPVTAKQRVVNF